MTNKLQNEPKAKSINQQVLDLKEQKMSATEIYIQLTKIGVKTTLNSVRFYFYGKKRLVAKNITKIN